MLRRQIRGVIGGRRVFMVMIIEKMEVTLL